MSEHSCLHEVDLGKMASNMERMAIDQTKILEALNGNGKDGLKTRMSLTEQSVKRAWKFLFAVVILLLAVGVKSL